MKIIINSKESTRTLDILRIKLLKKLPRSTRIDSGQFGLLHCQYHAKFPPLMFMPCLSHSTICTTILGDSAATSRDEAIFLGESLLQELKSPWELIPEVVEFRPADWAEKYFSAQSAMRSSRVTLSILTRSSFLHRSTY